MLIKALSQKSGIAPGIARTVKPCSFHIVLDKAGEKRGDLGQGLDPFEKIGPDSLWHRDKRIRCFIPATGLHVIHIITERVQPELCILPVQVMIATDHFGTGIGSDIAGHAQPVPVAKTPWLDLLRQVIAGVILTIGGQRMPPGSGIVGAVISGMVVRDELVGK